MHCWLGTTFAPERIKPKKHPQNSLPVHSISTFNTQQHLFPIQTPGEPLTLTVLCWDAVPTPGRGTHTRTRYPHQDAVPTPCPVLPPAAATTPWHRHRFLFTIILLRDYSGCGFLARPICLCSRLVARCHPLSYTPGYISDLAASAAGGSHTARLRSAHGRFREAAALSSSQPAANP